MVSDGVENESENSRSSDSTSSDQLEQMSKSEFRERKKFNKKVSRRGSKVEENSENSSSDDESGKNSENSLSDEGPKRKKPSGKLRRETKGKGFL